MILNSEDYQRIVSTMRVENNRNNREAWIIEINGARFVTSKGKSMWKKRQHAASAFNHEMAGSIKAATRVKLASMGYTSSYDIITHPEYKNAWTDFKKYIVETGIYKEVKLTF